MGKKTGKSTAVIDKNKKTENCVLNIEKESLRFLEVVRETDKEMNEYYPKMLDAHYSEEETDAKVESLKRSTANITKALAHTASISDELSARRNDIKNQNKKRRLNISSAGKRGN